MPRNEAQTRFDLIDPILRYDEKTGQTGVVARYESLRSIAERATCALERQLADVEKLPDALLRAAFAE
jgi:hypothetical protein